MLPTIIPLASVVKILPDGMDGTDMVAPPTSTPLLFTVNKVFGVMLGRDRVEDMVALTDDSLGTLTLPLVVPIVTF